MKRSYGLLAVSSLAAAVVFAGCSDDPAPQLPPLTGTAGTSTGGSSSAGSSTTAGTTSAGSFGTAGTDAGGTATAGTGTGGATAGTGGTTAGTAGTTAGTAGTGGAAHVIVPTVYLIDNLKLAPKAGGAGGDGAGGAGAGGDGAGGAAGGAGGAGGAPEANGLPDFLLTFDADTGPFKAHSDGFSPNVGGDTAGTPFIFDQTTLAWEAATGKPGGAAKISIPFSVPNQQADFGGAFAAPTDITGYELTADVKMVSTGDSGSCGTIFLYVYGGNGYANDLSAEPSAGVTRHLVKGEWTKVRLDLDGPYGYHSTKNHPNFKPTNMNVWGAQFNTFGCP